MFTIEGKTYDKRPAEKHKPLNPRVAQILMMASMFNGGLMNGSTSSKPRGYVNLEAPQLIKEYELILQKKSKYSYNQRQYIISTFEDRYVEVEPNDLVLIPNQTNVNNAIVRIIAANHK